MRVIDEQKLDYNDVSIISDQISYIQHRSTDIDISSEICGIKLEIPIIAAPMPDVCDSSTANKLRNIGAYGIIHRFQDIEEEYREFVNLNHVAICAIGVTGDYFDRFQRLYEGGCRHFCLDTANGANIQVEKAINRIKSDKIKIITGNIASGNTFKWLADLGVNSIRCGIAGGAACSTKIETGIYHPAVSCLLECQEIKEKFNLKSEIIADGGIKIPADFCKAILCGACAIMVGGIIAGCQESPAKTIKFKGVLHKIFRGAASFSVQKENSNKEPVYVEGHETIIQYEGPMTKVINRFASGLRSSMSYLNAKNIKEYRENAILAKI
jgi:IMP dehydrogenase